MINIFKKRRLKKQAQEEDKYQLELDDWKGRMLMGANKRKPTRPCVECDCKGKFGNHYHLPRFGYLKNYEWMFMRVEDFNAFVEEHKEDELIMNKIKNYHLRYRN